MTSPATRQSPPTRQKKKQGNNQDKLKCAEGKQDGCSNPYQLHSLWWSGHRKIHRGWSQRRRFLRQAINKQKKKPLKHDRAVDNMALVYETLRMSTLHFMMPLAFYCGNLAGTILQRDGNVQRRQ